MLGANSLNVGEASGTSTGAYTSPTPVEPASTDTTMLGYHDTNADKADFVPKDEAIVGASTDPTPVEPTSTDIDGNVNMLEATSLGRVIMTGSADTGTGNSDFENQDSTQPLDSNTNTDGSYEIMTQAIISLMDPYKELMNIDPSTAIVSTSVERFSTGSQEETTSGPLMVTNSGYENLKGMYWKRGYQQMNGTPRSTLINEIWKWQVHWKTYNSGDNWPFVFISETGEQSFFGFTYEPAEEITIPESCRAWYCQAGNYDEGVIGVFKSVSLHEVMRPNGWTWTNGTIFLIASSEKPDPDPVLALGDTDDLPGEMFFTYDPKEAVIEEL